MEWGTQDSETSFGFSHPPIGHRSSDAQAPGVLEAINQGYPLFIDLVEAFTNKGLDIFASVNNDIGLPRGYPQPSPGPAPLELSFQWQGSTPSRFESHREIQVEPER